MSAPQGGDRPNLRTRIHDAIERVSPPVAKFLVRTDKPYPLIREVLGIVAFLGLLAAILWGVTGQPFLSESPIVVVESESMMHCDPQFQSPGNQCERADGVPYGRWGTIDPGDLILVFDVEQTKDVVPWAEAVGDCSPSTNYLDCGCDGVETYGACGDVVIFQKSNGDPTPIIHRAVLYLEIHGGGRYSIDLPESWGCSDLVQVTWSELDDPCLGRLGFDQLNAHNRQSYDALGPEHSGFLTRGDNNNQPDQVLGIEPVPVQTDAILGKARAEIPWIGLVKLFVSDLTLGTQNFSRASGDAKVLMWIALGIIIAAPTAGDRILRRLRRSK